MNRSSKNMDWTIGKRLLTLAGALGLTAGLGFPPALDAQGPARKLGNTPPNFIGATDVYEDETTDLTLITSGAASEIWATDPFGDNISNPRRITSLGSNLTPASKRFINPNFGQRAFGLGEITHGPEAGLIFVLDPGLQQVGSPQPQLGLMDSNGNIAQTPQGLGTFRLIQGITQAVVLTSMDVHPFDDEIVVFDENNSTFSFLSFTANFEYQVVRGPFPILGSATFFGGGICYNPQDPEKVLVISRFRNNFESHVVLEYDRTSGAYTGRGISLASLPMPGEEMIAVGIDAGTFGGEDALFVYNVMDDAIYVVALEFQDFPGQVSSFTCTRTSPTALSLTWSNVPAFGYDSILIFQNQILIATLPATATEFTPPVFAGVGFNEYAVETRKGGLPNEIRSICVDQDSPIPPFNQFAGAQIAVDPSGNHFQGGIDCTSVVTDRTQFRIYMVGSFDRTVRVMNDQLVRVPAEDIILQPALNSTITGGAITNFAVTGIAIIDVGGEPMFAALDGDGVSGNLVPSASIHRMTGENFQSIGAIDLSAVGADGGFLFDWDGDPSGRLVAMDILLERLVLIEYDSGLGTLRAVAAAPVPQRTLTPFDGILVRIGGIAVLPNGLYLVGGGDTFDQTITRGFLTTPFDLQEPTRSVNFIGYEQGLITFNEFFIPQVFGPGIGPTESFGMAAAWFENDEVGVSYYTLPHVFPTPLTGFRGNILVNAAGASSNPALKGERLADVSIGFAPNIPFETGPLEPSFAQESETIDYFYHVFNNDILSPLAVRVEVRLGGIQDDSLTETLTLPPGRYIYRALLDRPEADISVVATNLGTNLQDGRIHVGARAVISGKPLLVFRRGDTDGNGVVEITDAVVLLGHLFLGDPAPLCLDAADGDDNGSAEITDAIVVLGYLFLGDPPPPAPGPNACGEDPSDDLLAPCVYDTGLCAP